MVVEARKLHLSSTTSHPSLLVTSAAVDPSSTSIALMLSDSSLLLFPPRPPHSSASPPPPPPPPTAIPSPSTAFSFLPLRPCSRVLFLSALPTSSSSAPSLLLRFWLLSSSSASFVPIPAAPSADIPLSASLSLSISSTFNFLSLYSPSARRLLLLSAVLSDAASDLPSVRISKCAAVDCSPSPVYSLRLSPSLLLLGELRGVRVFPLRPLAKGRPPAKARRRRELRSSAARPRGPENGDGAVGRRCETCCEELGNCCSGELGKSDGFCEGKAGARPDRVVAAAKRRTVKMRQDSGELGSFFVPFKCSEVQSPNGLQMVIASLKAVSIHVLSQQRFLILDSSGDMHLLSLFKTITGLEASAPCVPSRSGHMKHLYHAMKVQMLAVLPDISTRTHAVWIGDGNHSVHIMSLTESQSLGCETNDELEEKLTQNSAVQAIFTSEKVQDIVPYSANGVLIRGQGSIFVYAIA